MKGFPCPHEKSTSCSLLFYKKFDGNVGTIPLIQNSCFFKITESDLLEITTFQSKCKNSKLAPSLEYLQKEMGDEVYFWSQKDPMKQDLSVRPFILPSFCLSVRFLWRFHQVFLKLSLVLGAHIQLCVTAGFFEKKSPLGKK